MARKSARIPLRKKYIDERALYKYGNYQEKLEKVVGQIRQINRRQIPRKQDI